MKIFADVTEKMISLLPEVADKSALYSDELCAEKGDKNAILFRSDTAYELGGNGKTSVGSIVFTDLPSMQDEVILYGPDLSEINEDIPFAHLTFVSLKQKNDEELTCEQLKNIGFTAFQIYPKGYHIRISPSASKEQVRVAKTVLQSDSSAAELPFADC